MRKIRSVAWIICICLVFSTLSVGTSFAAEKAKAASFRLEKAEGTVEITGSNGKSISPSEGMLFYSGDVIRTSAKSYAYISLDDSKLLKIDELSQATVKKSGKKLEIKLDEGALYFEVNEKLAGDESMTIGTSTISLSIRGTAGVVRKRNISGNTQDTLWLLDGQVELTGIGTAAGREPITVWGGERIDYVESSGQWQRDLINIMEIPGFADVQMRENSVLMQRVLSDSGLDTEWITLNADNKIDQDQQSNQQLYADIFEQKMVPTAAPSPMVDVQASPVPEPSQAENIDHSGNASSDIVVPSSAPDGDGNDSNLKGPDPQPTSKPDTTPELTPSATVIPTATPESGEDTGMIHVFFWYYPEYPNEKIVELFVDFGVKRGDTVVPDKIPEISGYRFVGWNGNYQNVTDYEDVYPMYEPCGNDLYIVKFVDSDGTILKVEQVEYGGYATPPDAPARIGYEFKGWNGQHDNVTEDRIITAEYYPVEEDNSTNTPEPDPTPVSTPEVTPAPDPTATPEGTYYKIYFYDFDSSYLDDQMVLEGQLPIAPEPPIHSGYQFTGWSPEISEAYEDRSYHAVFEKIQ